MLPTFLKKALLSPWLIGGAIGVGLVATLPLWHVKPPNAADIAARQFASMQANMSASAASEKPEAPDPSPTAFPVRTVAPAQIVAQLVRPHATPSPTTVAQSVAVASAAVAQPQASTPQPSATPEPLPPADTHGVWASPDGQVQPTQGAPAPRDVVRSPGPQFRTDAGGIAVGYVPAVSRYELQQGAVIHARLLGHIDSEQPGITTAQVTEAVYASRDSSVEIIPAGAKLVGRYDTASSGQTRLQISWTRLEFPDGVKFDFDEPSADTTGGSGVGGQVNSHAGSSFGRSALYTLLNSVGNVFTRSSTVFVGGGLTQSIPQPQPQKPTIYLDPTAVFEVIASRDLPFDAYREAAQ